MQRNDISSNVWKSPISQKQKKLLKKTHVRANTNSRRLMGFENVRIQIAWLRPTGSREVSQTLLSHPRASRKNVRLISSHLADKSATLNKSAVSGK